MVHSASMPKGLIPVGALNFSDPTGKKKANYAKVT